MIEVLEPRRVMSAVSAVDDSFVIPAQATPAPMVLDVLPNDYCESGTLTISAVGSVTHGTVTIQAAVPNDPDSHAMLLYTPEAGYDGAESFTYTVSDGDGDQATATVMLALTGSGTPSGSGNEGEGYGSGTGDDPNASTGGAYSSGSSGSGGPNTSGTGTSGSGTSGYGTGGYGSSTDEDASPLSPYLEYAEYHTDAIQPFVFVDYLGLVPVYQDQTDALNEVLGAFASPSSGLSSASESLAANQTVITQFLGGTQTVVTVTTGTHTTTVDSTTGAVTDQVVMTYDITTTFDDTTGHDFVLHQWGSQTLLFEFVVTANTGNSGTDTTTYSYVDEYRTDNYEFVMNPDFTDPIEDDTEDTTDNWSRNTTGSIHLIGHQSSTLTASLTVTTNAADVVALRHQNQVYAAGSDVSDDIDLVLTDLSPDFVSSVTTTSDVVTFDDWAAKSYHDSIEVQGVRTSVTENYHAIGDGTSKTAFSVVSDVDVTKISSPPTNSNNGTSNSTSGTTTVTPTPVMTHTVIVGINTENAYDKYSFLAYGSAKDTAAVAYSKYDDDAYGSSLVDTTTAVTITQGTTVLTLSDDPYVANNWTSKAHGYGSSTSQLNPDWSGTAGWTKWTAKQSETESGSTGGTTSTGTTANDPPISPWVTSSGKAWVQYDDTDQSYFDTTTLTGSKVIADDGKGTVTKYQTDNKVHTSGTDESIGKTVDTELQTGVENISFSSLSWTTAWGLAAVVTDGKTVLDVANSSDSSTLVSRTETKGSDFNSDWSQSDSVSLGNTATDAITRVRVSWDDTTTNDKAYGSSLSTLSISNNTDYDRVLGLEDYDKSDSYESSQFKTDTPAWTSSGKDHSYSKTTSTPFDVDADGKIEPDQEYEVQFQLDSDSDYAVDSATTALSDHTATGSNDTSARGPDGSLTTYVSSAMSINLSKNDGTNKSWGDSHLNLTDTFTVGGKATTTTTTNANGVVTAPASTAKIVTWSNDESHSTTIGFESSYGKAKTDYDVTKMSSQQMAVAPAPPNDPPEVLHLSSTASTGALLSHWLFGKSKNNPYGVYTADQTRTVFYGLQYETDDLQNGITNTKSHSNIQTIVGQDQVVTTVIDAGSDVTSSTTYATALHQHVDEEEDNATERKYTHGYGGTEVVEGSKLSAEQDVVDRADGTYNTLSGSKTLLTITATPNPVASSTATTAGGASGKVAAYSYSLTGTDESWSDEYDLGKEFQSQSASSLMKSVSTPLNFESWSSSYQNDGDHDFVGHQTSLATYSGGETPDTKAKDWSIKTENAKYETTASDGFGRAVVIVVPEIIEMVTGFSQSNGYSETGTLWTQAKSEIITETWASGAADETTLNSYDTIQAFDSHVSAQSQDGYTYSNAKSVGTQLTSLFFDDWVHRDETTHTEDKLHAVTPASAAAKVALSTWSKSDWTRDEESKTILNVMIDAKYGALSDSGGSSTDVNISVGQNDKSTVAGAWGKSTLDVAADGTQTSTKSGLVVTDFENKAGMSYVVSGTFTEAPVAGTFLVTGSSGSLHTGIDRVSVLNEERKHLLDDTTTSGDSAGFSLTFAGPDYTLGLGSFSGSDSKTTHRLYEEFVGEKQAGGFEWTKVKGEGATSSGGTYAASVGGTTSTTTNSMTSESKSDGGASRVWAVFPPSSYGSGGTSGYGTTGSQAWQLDGFTGNDKGQSTTTTTDGSQSSTREMHSDVTGTLSPRTGGGQTLDLSGGYGSSESTTTPKGYGSGSVTTGTQQDVSLNGYTFQVSDDTALTLIETPLSAGASGLVNGGSVGRTLFAIPLPGLGEILVDPPGTLLALPNLGGALGTASPVPGPLPFSM